MQDVFTRDEVADLLDHVADEVACLPGFKSGQDDVSKFAEAFRAERAEVPPPREETGERRIERVIAELRAGASSALGIGPPACRALGQPACEVTTACALACEADDDCGPALACRGRRCLWPE